MEKDVIKRVRDLVELDFDAIEAYDAAIERLEDPVCKAQLAAFRDDHRRHVAELSSFLVRAGVTPPTHGDFKRMFTKGKVLFGGLIGDRAILIAMKTNEDETNAKYERAVERGGVEQARMDVFARNLADERRHRAWIEERLTAERPRVRVDRPSSDSLL